MASFDELMDEYDDDGMNIEFIQKFLPKDVKCYAKCSLEANLKNPPSKPHSLSDQILGVLVSSITDLRYDSLSKSFSLPSRMELETLLEKIPMAPGIDEALVAILQQCTLEMMPQQRICTLLFDEIEILPRVVFSLRANRFYGLVGPDSRNKASVAHRALVFMARGIQTDWKLPVAFVLSEKPLNHERMAEKIRKVVARLRRAGLTVVATTSKHTKSLVKAVDFLKVDNSRDVHKCCFYSVDGVELVHVYDPPELMKDLRDRLMESDLVWEKQERKLVGRWEHVVKTYEMDRDIKYLRVLTEEHIRLTESNKRKVKYAIQVFSYRMAALMSRFLRLTYPQYETARDTAHIIEFFDKLFDSANSPTKKKHDYKALRCAISGSSPHYKFWQEAKETIRKMYFQKDSSQSVPPVLTHWLETINSLQAMIFVLRGRRVKLYSSRRFNLDPLRNFLNQLRRESGISRKVTSQRLENRLKAHVVRNINSLKSMNIIVPLFANILRRKNLIAIVEKLLAEGDKNQTDLSVTKQFKNVAFNSPLDTYPIHLLRAFLAKYRKTMMFCNTCGSNSFCDRSEWKNLTCEEDLAFNKKIPHVLKTYKPQLVKGLAMEYKIIAVLLPLICHRSNSFLILMEVINDNVKFQLCEHLTEVTEKIKVRFARYICFQWAKGLNRNIRKQNKKFKKGKVLRVKNFKR